MTLTLDLPDAPGSPPGAPLRQSILDALLAAMPSFTLDEVAGGLAALSADIAHLRREVALRQMSLAADLALRHQLLKFPA